MALTAAQFQAWLETSSARRCILVEVVVNINGTETTLYLSNRNYATGLSDTPANTLYQPVIQTSLAFNQTLPIDSTASLSYGDIAIDNTNGVRDSWLNYIWANRQINIYFGDITFARSDFTKIYSGYVADIASSDRNTLNISIRDLLQKLNTPITSAVVGGTGQNKEALRPLVFGEVFNITPVLLDASTLTYMVHNGPIERIIEIRDNGVPLTINTSYTENLTSGTFTLLRSPVGEITCSVQGEKTTVNSSGALVTNTYSNTVAKIIEVILLKYGTQQLSATDIDLTTFNTFDTNNQAPVGIYINSNSNVISVCQELAASIGAQFTSNRNGLVTLLKVDIPTNSTGIRTISDADILQGTLKLDSKVPVQGAIKLGYCKNYTLQNALLTGIPDSDKNSYNTEYIAVVAKDTLVLNAYNQSAEPDVKPTLMITNAGSAYVSTEANRLLNLWKLPRFIFSMECTAKYLNINLGDNVILNHYRFGLSGSKYGQIISMSTNWDTGRVNLGILV
jgi:hypothetical protein